MTPYRLFAAALLGALACAARADAGLVIEVHGTIDGTRVRDLAIDRGSLVVTYAVDAKNEKFERRWLQLPPGALGWVAYWAAGRSDGPVIVSIDGAFVGSGQTYVPPALREGTRPTSPPNPLGDALLAYDVYAHNLAQGAVPGNPRDHPLVARLGNESGLPYRQFERLSDPANAAGPAVTYRRLAERYPRPLGETAIGEFTVRVKPAPQGFPVRVEVDPYLTVLGRAWYRPIVVPSEWDRATALLPYAALHRDMQDNWPAYRRAFRPMDEVSAVAEAFALLRAVNRGNQPLWDRFRDRLTQGLPDDEFRERLPDFAAARAPELRRPGWATARWPGLCAAALGDKVDTTSKADLALSLLSEAPTAGTADERKAWREQLAERAKRDARLEAKLTLFDALRADPEDAADWAAQFFKLARARPEFFRLWVHGLRRLERVDGLEKLAADERRAAVDAFRAQVAAAEKAGAAPDVRVWEELSQNVYSVDLTDLLLADPRVPEKEALRLLAAIHYRRGLAPQVGREVAYQHANFRFLGYLAAKADKADPRLARDIRGYQTELAREMKLVGWEEDQ